MHLVKPTQLAGKWLVQLGDNQDYARQDFDDRQWRPFDLSESIEPVFPQHPSIIWYRLHISVDPSTTGLALDEVNISGAFEIYVNGELLLKVGSINPLIRYTAQAMAIIPIPQRMMTSGELVVAARVWTSPIEWRGQYPGLYVSNLLIGQERSLYDANWLDVIGGFSIEWFQRLLLVALGFVALVLFTSQRRQTVYLWIFAVGALTLVEFPIPFITQFRNIPTYWELIGALPRLVAPFFWVSLYFSFVQQRIGWIFGGILAVAGIGDFVSGLQQWLVSMPSQYQLLSNLTFTVFSNLPFVILLSVVVPVVLVIHWRRGNREAGILLIPSVLFSLYIYAEVGLEVLFQFPAWREPALRGLHLIDRYPVGPFSVSLNSISGILSTVALAVIMLERSAALSRRQAQLDTELEAAREVQRVLVPEQRGTVPGFKVETAYEPAQQVGGDFFQILPASEGGVMVVIGDVAGKGLPAAMLVSVLVGAISGLSEYSTDPAEMLTGLNERLVGRSGGGFSTALAAHFTAGGLVTIANAGHLSPYLDGKEVELPGALPLGVTNSTQYETIEFQLNAGSRLTFYSDGVIEAQRPDGELFGFERAREVSVKPAAEIVQTVKRFGQEDDITVVTVTRTAAVATAA
jgi:sigma-B regulation protein RsbU (phosphoserine phosphatase)